MASDCVLRGLLLGQLSLPAPKYDKALGQVDEFGSLD